MSSSILLADGRTLEDKMFDRQVRLWGPHGQRKLRTGTALVLGSTHVISETLKNLVLPGLGGYVMVDDATTVVSDLGASFFLMEEDVGTPRVYALRRNLEELNPSVKSTAVFCPVADFVISLASQAGAPASMSHVSVSLALADYACVIADPALLPLPVLLLLDSLCREANTALLLPSAMGLVGQVRICTYDRPIAQTNHMDGGVQRDLWLSPSALQRFRALTDYALRAQFDATDMPRVCLADVDGEGAPDTAAPAAGETSTATHAADLSAGDLLHAHAHTPALVLIIRAAFLLKRGRYFADCAWGADPTHPRADDDALPQCGCQPGNPCARTRADTRTPLPLPVLAWSDLVPLRAQLQRMRWSADELNYQQAAQWARVACSELDLSRAHVQGALNDPRVGGHGTADAMGDGDIPLFVGPPPTRSSSTPPAGGQEELVARALQAMSLALPLTTEPVRVRVPTYAAGSAGADVGFDVAAEAEGALSTLQLARVLVDATYLPAVPCTLPRTHRSAPFAVVLAALRAFASGPAGGGALPRRTSLPDMVAGTRVFTALQRLVARREAWEREIMQGLLGRAAARQLAWWAAQESGAPATDACAVSEAEGLSWLCGAWEALFGERDVVAHVCTHCYDMQWASGRTLAQERAADALALPAASNAPAAPACVCAWTPVSSSLDECAEETADMGVLKPFPGAHHWYVAMRGAQLLKDAWGRWPGQATRWAESDGENMRGVLSVSAPVAVALGARASSDAVLPVDCAWVDVGCQCGAPGDSRYAPAGACSCASVRVPVVFPPSAFSVAAKIDTSETARVVEVSCGAVARANDYGAREDMEDGAWERDSRVLAHVCSAVRASIRGDPTPLRDAVHAAEVAADATDATTDAPQQPPDDEDVYGGEWAFDARAAKELCREACAPIHVCGATVGALAGDATMKAILGQYVLADNTLVWDGVGMGGGVLKV